MTGIDLEALLSQAPDPRQRVASFALLCLGAIESLVSGAIRASDAIRLLFHADNCLFVREHLQRDADDEVMSRGVQLPDLFDALPAEEAQQEYQRELAAMHTLCLKLIEDRESAAA
ncbi:MAG: hypothetical protein GY719_27140 [bacterium]|nr:hypothetical protein [bacterium]